MRTSWFVGAAMLVAWVSGTAGADEALWSRNMVVQVHVPADQVPRLVALDLDVWSLRDGVAEILVSQEELARLAEQGWRLVVIDDHVRETLAARRSLARAAKGPWTSYHDLAGVYAFLNDLHNAHPAITALATIGSSIEGRSIVALRISDDAATVNPEEPASLFLGCHHAREWISVEVPLFLAEYLVTNYASDPDVQRLVDSSEIWIVPVVNPDGFNYSWTAYRLWRKNRRHNGDGSYGVDLNRNYAYQWGGPGSSGTPSYETYRGTEAFSEPETQAVRDLFEGANGRPFGALLTYHSYSQLVLYPWSYTISPPPDLDLLSGMASAMADLINGAHSDPQYDYVDQQSAALYPSSGDTTDWAYALHDAAAFTIELRPIDWSHGGFELPPEQILPTCQENLPAALCLMDWVIPEPPVQPGDFDLDTDVDQEDFGRLQVCLTGSGNEQTDPSCEPALLDGDSDVDHDDVILFVGCMSGPGQPASLSCADQP